MQIKKLSNAVINRIEIQTRNGRLQPFPLTIHPLPPTRLPVIIRHFLFYFKAVTFADEARLGLFWPEGNSPDQDLRVNSMNTRPAASGR